MTEPRYRCYTGDLVTGGPLREIDLPDVTWTAPFTGAGTVEGSHPLAAGTWPTNYEDTMPGKRCLVVTYDPGTGAPEKALEGGPIWRTDYDRNKPGSPLKLAAAGIWSYLDHLKALPLITDKVEKLHMRFGGSRAAIAAQLLDEVVSALPATAPIVIPDLSTLGAGSSEHNYPGHELGWLGERLKQLSEVIDGPEIQFAPRLVQRDGAKWVDWVMRLGTTATGNMVTQDGAPHVLEARAALSGVRNITATTDGTRLADRVFSAGQGQGEGRPIEYARSETLTDRGWPSLDAEVTSTDNVTNRDTLTGHALERIAIGTNPSRTIGVHWQRDAAPSLSDLSAGDWTVLRLSGDHHLPDGETSQRIVQLAGGSGTDRAFVSLSMQEGSA